MPLRAFLPLLAAALPACAIAAAPGALDVKTIAYKGSLPYIVSGDLVRDARINHRIFIDVAEQAAPAKFADGIKAPKEEDSSQGSSDFSFTVLRNDKRMLSLALDAEGCGAYCEHFTTEYNFDAVTGRTISAADIFTPAGGATLLKQALATRIAEYRKEIAGLNREAADKRKKQRAASSKTKARPDAAADEDETRIAETVDMYQSCVEGMRAPDYSAYYTLQNASLQITAQSITFMYGRCSNHAMQALDEIGDQKVSYKVSDIAQHFTPYGKYLMLDGPLVAPRPDPYRQILHGHIRQAAITFQLTEQQSDGAVVATYFYDRYRKLIRLGGKVNGNVLELAEVDSTEKPQPVIRAVIKGETLEGQWVGKKAMEFRVTP